jgi:hypothetical protein
MKTRRLRISRWLRLRMELDDCKKHFPDSFRSMRGWFVFLMVCVCIDSLLLTLAGVSAGFTEKGFVVARVMEVNYLLGASVSILSTAFIGLVLILLKLRNILIITSLVYFGAACMNYTIINLYAQSLLSPF